MSACSATTSVATPDDPASAAPGVGSASPSAPNPATSDASSTTSAAPSPTDSSGVSPQTSAAAASPTARASAVAPQTVRVGTFDRVTLPRSTWGGSGRVVWYTLEVQPGIGVDLAEAARTVSSVLEDKRGWQTVDGVDFRPAPLDGSGRIDVKVTIAAPVTVDRLCRPLRTNGWLSCWNGERALLNSDRWLVGAESWGTDVAGYRTYLVSHEVGHGIGHSHVPCPGRGRPAPVMHQQTKSLSGCLPNPWPAGT